MNPKTSKNSSLSTIEATDSGTSTEIFSYATCETAFGRLLVARSSKGICAILMADDDVELKADLAQRFPKVKLVRNEPLVRDDLAKVICFIEKPSDGLHLTLDMRGTVFQRSVWQKLRAILVGRTVTYMELARWISPLASARAVAGACAANPIALAIPSHRVVRSDGDLAGYRWGIDRKRELLRKEAMA
jgi:AraC family transcriptional regulator, regulatory protein of adaptative response / methylated-DNA-[protein]-cysteine methyltransferase